MPARSPLRIALRGTAIYMVVVLAANALFGLPMYSLGTSAVIASSMAGMLYVKECYPWHQPKLWMALGAVLLFIYGRGGLFSNGIPDSAGERVWMTFVVSLPLILVILGAWTMWRRPPLDRS